ncbi:gamma carbonic anhydrase family protein [Sinosporangium siamense]|uniref:Gamma carbonic anhydrase family protein n=1 Tax=Sinosporangium siamense TaxID=1367973 RepID=A0A919V7H3_9ACTN|nr:gamma carbonic anhydrase family protein [Sinosporangium siamense]GII95130.1 gamma carbonic anhydrase family protein [Sinosporangium siamense]
MGAEDRALVLALDGAAPAVDASAWVAPGATVVGAVVLEVGVGVWYSAVVRGDGDRIVVGAGSNVQDGAVLHADPGFPVQIGAGVTIGHRAVVHGAVIGDGSLVGMGAIVLNGAVVGERCLLAAGSLVLEGAVIPAGSLVVGSPGRVLRPLTAAEIADIEENARDYRANAERHRAAQPV